MLTEKRVRAELPQTLVRGSLPSRKAICHSSLGLIPRLRSPRAEAIERMALGAEAGWFEGMVSAAEPRPGDFCEGLNKLTIGDSKNLKHFFSNSKHLLSNYSFIDIYIWKDFFDFYWYVFEGIIYIFAKHNSNLFMPVPPLGKGDMGNAIKWAFDFMKSHNTNNKITRIENIEKDKTMLYKSLEYKISLKGYEYIYDTKALIQLKGNFFKGKRSACNYFVKNNRYTYEDFRVSYKNECLMLYQKWQNKRLDKFKDPFFKALAEDSFLAHKCVMNNYGRLDLVGRIIRIGNNIKAYTFGFKLNEEVFCVLFEIADPAVKGLSQFIFREFCKEYRNFKFINTLDDSGLENLKKAKLSYKPVLLAPSYIATID